MEMRAGMIDFSKWPPTEVARYRKLIRDIRRDLDKLKKERAAGANVPESIINMFEEFLEEREERTPH